MNNNITENITEIGFSVIFEKMNAIEKQIKLLEKKVQFQDCVIFELLKSVNGDGSKDTNVDLETSVHFTFDTYADPNNKVLNPSHVFDISENLTRSFEKLKLDDLSTPSGGIPPPLELKRQHSSFDNYCTKSGIDHFKNSLGSINENTFHTIDLETGDVLDCQDLFSRYNITKLAT